jgi:hypothetical protein
MVAETRQDAAAADKRKKQLLHYLNLAMDQKISQEAAVIKNSFELLRGLEYDDENSIVFIGHAIPFLIYGEYSIAPIEVCIMDDNEKFVAVARGQEIDGDERSGTSGHRRGH